MRDKHQVIEEPCEFKGSSTVLESSGSCEGVADFTRSCHDAVEAIHTAICQKAKYVLDADIAKCFDKINHQKLLAKLNTFPKFEQAIRGWLKSGVIDQGTLFPTEEGTPQGGVISPLLANIALHGLETILVNSFPAKMKLDGKWHLWKPQVIRYADDVRHLTRR